MRVIASLTVRPFLSSSSSCEVILIHKLCLSFRMHYPEYHFRTIISAVFGPCHHTDDWEELLRLRPFTDIIAPPIAFLSGLPLSWNKSDNVNTDMRRHARHTSRNLCYTIFYMWGRSSIHSEMDGIQYFWIYGNVSRQNANLERPAESCRVWRVEMSQGFLHFCEH